MQRVRNYGSFLQAYALKQLITSFGAEVYFIDIIPGEKLENNSIETLKSGKLIKALNLIIKPFDLLAYFRKKRFYSEFTNKYDNAYFPLLEPGKSNPEKFDLVVIGSDEVFNGTQPSPWGFTTQLFGDISNSDCVISYAASCGYTTIDRIEKFNLRNSIAKALSNLKEISVRDENTFNVVKSLTGNEPIMHLDPVLIYNFSKEVNSYKIQHVDYILIYAKLISDSEEIKAIRQFARKKKKKILCLYCYYSWADFAIVPETPFELLAYFKYADFVISDTFHGTIFSIINERKFITLIRKSNIQKLTFLLESFGLFDRIIKDFALFSEKLQADIDYKIVARRLEEERQNAMDYLGRFAF